MTVNVNYFISATEVRNKKTKKIVGIIDWEYSSWDILENEFRNCVAFSKKMQEADILKDHKTNKRISEVNKKLKDICKEEKVTYIDTYSALLDENKELKRSYAEDGLHLTALGYIKVTNVLMPYINDEVE